MMTGGSGGSGADSEEIIYNLNIFLSVYSQFEVILFNLIHISRLTLK